jgi:protein arginine N-methyltransferase 3
MTPSDQDFTSEFTLTATSLTPVECHAIVLWFDTDFSSKHCSETPVKLSTSVHKPPTHWSQTVLVLKEPVMMVTSDSIQGTKKVTHGKFQVPGNILHTLHQSNILRRMTRFIAGLFIYSIWAVKHGKE